MSLHGRQIIAGETSAESGDRFFGIDPSNGQQLEPPFYEATAAEIGRCLEAARDAFDDFRSTTPAQRADFLEAIADEALALGDTLLERASSETGHPIPRCIVERDRSVNQARLFAQFIREGSWVDARIDQGDPGRNPMPKPDVRSLLQPVGPVVVFGASNFPIAISVLGSDTISAFACGCPIVIKAHPAHPGTCEVAANAILAAIEKTGMPTGIFSMVHGRGTDVGVRLVDHPEATAAAFTGSLGGGRALFDVASKRPVPIPFYAEMGSVNPIFLLPGALAERGDAIAEEFVTSLTTGVGQFCTNPGLVFGLDSPQWKQFSETAAGHVRDYSPQTMLHAGIHHAYCTGVESRRHAPHLELLAESDTPPIAEQSQAACYLFATTADGFEGDPDLKDELFGPVSTLVECTDPGQLASFAEGLTGSLTASVHGTEVDLENHRDLIAVLERKVGRLIFNGYPVGLEVCHSIHHGGPYPATCHSHFTSIGTRCINRFVRPVCYQNWPDSQLPEELQNGNPRGVWRLVDGERTQNGI